MGLCPRPLGELTALPHSLASEEGADIKIVATRCQILRLKCTKFHFGCGSAPDPLGSFQRSPTLPSWWGGEGLTVHSPRTPPRRRILAPLALIGRPPKLNTNQRPGPAVRKARSALVGGLPSVVGLSFKCHQNRLSDLPSCYGSKSGLSHSAY